MTTAAAHLRTDAMTRAWAMMKKDGAKFSRWMFARFLRFAWSDAKAAARGVIPVSDMTPEQHELASLQNVRNPTAEDHKRMIELTTALAHKEAEPDYAEKRDLIASAGGRFCAVTFTKADGSERTMRIQPATLRQHIKGDQASDTARRGSATRKARHPHLLPVWDAEANAPRSVNLATVSLIEVGSETHSF